MRRGEEGIKDNIIKTIIENNKHYNDPIVDKHLRSGALADLNENQLRSYLNMFFDDTRRGWLNHVDLKNLPGTETPEQQVERTTPPEIRNEPISSPSQTTSQPQGTNTPPRERTQERVPERVNRPDMPDVFSGLPESFRQNLEQAGIIRPDSSLSVQGDETGEDSEYLARREKVHNFLNDFQSVLGPVRDVIGLIEERRNERRAERLVDESIRNRPQAPGVRGENRILSGLIRDSQIAASNPMRHIQPFMEQTNLGFQQDLARGQELSGGQAGVAMGLGQAASLRRDQANRQGGMLAHDAYTQGIGRTASLVGQQMQDNNQRDFQQMRLFEHQDRRNQLEQQAAGQALAFSTARRLQQRNNVWDSLLNSPVFDVDSYMNLTRNNLMNR